VLTHQVTLVAVATSNGQTGVIGTTLPLPLRAQVRSDGAPKAGVTVFWRPFAGSVSPTESITDSDGFAVTAWTLGTAAGVTATDARIAGAQPASVAFRATALGGPAVAIDTVSGDGQTLPANRTFSSLIAVVTDQYGNGVKGESVTWTVESGPVAFRTMGGTTDAGGRSAAIVEPSGTVGAAVVRAALPGGAPSVDFTLTIGPPEWAVALNTNGSYAFVSAQNNSSSPAVDTIPAGRTMKWTLEPFDYDQHGVVSVGSPSFERVDFPYGNPSTVSVTFTTPGTYHYADPYYPGVTGIVVVQ
jgi:plastocyanin